MGFAPLSPTQNKFGAGTIYMAPLATAVPTLTVVAGKFTQAFTGWYAVGGTSAGLTLTRNPATSDFNVAESFYPQHILQTGDDMQGSFTIDQINKQNLAFAMNAASAATLAGAASGSASGAQGNFSNSGTGASRVTAFNLPAIGSQVDCMLAWQSQDDDEVVFMYEVTQVASVAPNMNKGPQAQELLMQLRCVLPATNPDLNVGATSTQVQPWRWYFAGTLFDPTGTLVGQPY